MAWEMRLSLDSIRFSLDSGGFRGDGPRVCLPVDMLLEMGLDDFESLKEWASEYAKELSALEWARECQWDTQFLKVDQLLLILQGKVATDEERRKAKQVIEDSLQGIRHKRAIDENLKPPGSKTVGYIYLLSADNGLFKIGKAKRLDDRVTQLGVKLPMKIVLIHAIESYDYTWAEMHLHDMFSAKREHGEWFKLEAEDVERIKGISRLDPPS